MNAALELLAALAEATAEPLDTWHTASELVEAEAIDYDQFDELRDEAAYRVLDALEQVLILARAAGVLPDLDAEPVPYVLAEADDEPTHGETGHDCTKSEACE